jgi:hypothetical protein
MQEIHHLFYFLLPTPPSSLSQIPQTTDVAPMDEI